jgi:UDP:flavonoid glycosyltransferase YjiC (YdhE family)
MVASTQALSFGIPLVSAGLTEDKADVNARVAWSGVGIDLATNAPSPEALREAIRTVLDKPNHRSQAQAMAQEFALIHTRSEILPIISETVRGSARDNAGRRKVVQNKSASLQGRSDIGVMLDERAVGREHPVP